MMGIWSPVNHPDDSWENYATIKPIDNPEQINTITNIQFLQIVLFKNVIRELVMVKRRYHLKLPSQAINNKPKHNR